MNLSFVRVRELVPDDQAILDVLVGTPAAEALRLMRSHNVDQLPVRAANGHVVGVFSHRSLARGLPYVPGQNPLATPVDDLVEDLPFVASSERMEKVLEPLAIDNAVLVGDEERLLAVVTPADLNRFLWRRTQPFLLLRDIELGVRDLMSSCCAADDLAASITAALPAVVEVQRSPPSHKAFQLAAVAADGRPTQFAGRRIEGVLTGAIRGARNQEPPE